MMKNRWLPISLCIACLSLCFAALVGMAHAANVTRTGSQLYLNGNPYKFTGLNVYNANSRSNCSYSMGNNDSVLGDSLTNMGSGKEAFRAWFFQPLATSGGTRDWAAFDHTLSVAAAKGYKVIATLGNQWGNQCDGSPDATSGYRNEAWYQTGYYQTTNPQGTTNYKSFVYETVYRYRNDDTILAWELLNEPQAGISNSNRSCSSTCNASMKAWAADMAWMIDWLDPSTLISIGVHGEGQAGAQGAAFKDLHSVSQVDLCSYHDYEQPSVAVPNDGFNLLATRISQCNELSKPLFVGEVGIRLSTAGSQSTRATWLTNKLSAQQALGVDGHLSWEWHKDNCSFSDFAICPTDPALTSLGAY